MSAKVALIVERDNARLSEVDWARDMLRRVSAQTAAAARTTNPQILGDDLSLAPHRSDHTSAQ
jgi:hypothetical protein